MIGEDLREQIRFSKRERVIGTGNLDQAAPGNALHNSVGTGDDSRMIAIADQHMRRCPSLGGMARTWLGGVLLLVRGSSVRHAQ
jgi:hypothetical protein